MAEFNTNTVAAALAEAGDRLRAVGSDTPDLDARVLLRHATGQDDAWLFANGEAEIVPTMLDSFVELLARRELREPISQIIASREFWSRDFRVTPDVLTPRPDSESLVKTVLTRIKDRDASLHILDLGTGSGCLLLTLLAECPNATGLGVDASAAALDVAAGNAAALGVDARVEWREGDWCEGLDGEFDVIVSNPPYIARHEMRHLEPEVRDYEPNLALDGGADGLSAYRQIVPALPRLGTSRAVIALELGLGQAKGVAALGRVAGLRIADVDQDISRRARVITFEPVPNV
ncbi:MAG: protein-(glutamine-N5) methyltransferase, release factor-specific [Alphaproteobacteria bacterium]|nr:protein-(glutamine-N5) methyltransferase, release factor-specific [Alphaproteobacteria bacterium]